MSNKFSVNLKYIRRKRKITQVQLAELLSVTDGTISNWENEISFPSLSVLVEISNILSVSIDNLLKSDLTRGEVKNPSPPSALSNEQLNKLEFYESMIKAHCPHLAELLNLS